MKKTKHGERDAEIRRLATRGTPHKVLAADYGVTPARIWQIANQWVPPPIRERAWPDLVNCTGGFISAMTTCSCRRPKPAQKAYCCGLCAGGRHTDACTFRSVRLGMSPSVARETHFYHCG